MNLPDRILNHLSQVVERPDLSASRYEMIDRIGRGGMSTVYRVRDSELEREVALKVIDAPADNRGQPLQEARLVASLEHPGIVTVHDAGVLPDGRPFCVMQLVEGVALDRFLEHRPGLSERLSVFEKLCEAVAFAHSRGVIHRDLKPSNVMVGSFGRVVVLDWGIALRNNAPLPGGIAGTWQYMSPEQREGGAPDERGDIYSLGVLLKEMLPANAPRPLRAIAAKASADDRNTRYCTVDEIMRDIRRFRDRLPVSAYRENPWEALARYAVRNRVLLLLVLAYVLVRILLFFARPH